MDDVDHVDSQLAERLVDAALHGLGCPVRRAGDSIAHLRGDHRLSLPPAERAPDALLRRAVAPRRVEQRDPEIERRVDEPLRFEIRDPEIAEGPRAQPERRDHETRMTESACLHGGFLADGAAPVPRGRRSRQ